LSHCLENTPKKQNGEFCQYLAIFNDISVQSLDELNSYLCPAIGFNPIAAQSLAIFIPITAKI